MATPVLAPGLLTVPELAARTGHAERQLLRLAEAGRIPGAVDVGRGRRHHWRFPARAVYALRPDLDPGRTVQVIDGVVHHFAQPVKGLPLLNRKAV